VPPAVPSPLHPMPPLPYILWPSPHASSSSLAAIARIHLHTALPCLRAQPHTYVRASPPRRLPLPLTLLLYADSSLFYFYVLPAPAAAAPFSAAYRCPATWDPPPIPTCRLTHRAAPSHTTRHTAYTHCRCPTSLCCTPLQVLDNLLAPVVVPTYRALYYDGLCGMRSSPLYLPVLRISAPVYDVHVRTFFLPYPLPAYGLAVLPHPTPSICPRAHMAPRFCHTTHTHTTHAHAGIAHVSIHQQAGGATWRK